MTSRKVILLAIILCLFLFTSCSTTSITGSWKKSDYLGQPLTSVLVVGLTGDPHNKLLWENVMADRLRQNGVKTAITTQSAFPNDSKIDKEEIINFVKKEGVQAVLVTRLVDTKKEEVYYPPRGVYHDRYAYGHYRHFDYYYPYAYDIVYSPGYTATWTTILLETNLYKSDNQELIWSMSSDTYDPKSINHLVESVSEKVLVTLKDDQLI